MEYSLFPITPFRWHDKFSLPACIAGVRPLTDSQYPTLVLHGDLFFLWCQGVHTEIPIQRAIPIALPQPRRDDKSILGIPRPIMGEIGTGSLIPLIKDRRVYFRQNTFLHRRIPAVEGPDMKNFPCRSPQLIHPRQSRMCGIGDGSCHLLEVPCAFRGRSKGFRHPKLRCVWIACGLFPARPHRLYLCLPQCLKMVKKGIPILQAVLHEIGDGE